MIQTFGDNHFLAWTGIMTIVMQLLFFFVAYAFQFDKVTDLAGSMNFILIDLFTLCAAGFFYPRQVLVTVLVGISKLYLAGYLFSRVMKRGHDARFDETRGNFFKFLAFWIFQMIWCWGVSLSVIFINSDPANPSLRASDWVGLAVFIIGLYFEVVGDLQKDAFRSDPKNNKDFMHSGVWAISRHPNFFGEMFMWWGIFIIGVPVYDASSSNWGYATIIAPLLTMAILLFLSGMPTAEGDNQKRFLRDSDTKKRYLEYRKKTSPIVPMPAFLWENIPHFFQRWLFFEYDMYAMDWNFEVAVSVTLHDPLKNGAP